VTLLDSNVLIDIFGRNSQWWQWSLARVQEARRAGPLLINDIVYAETSIRFRIIEDFDAALAGLGVTLAPISRMALFVAGKAFAEYRRVGGVRTGVLPDFFIGAHAEAERLPLLTRDVRRYRHYFPAVDRAEKLTMTGRLP
jgi:predicted nucleic acid-binding protein